MKKNRVLVVRSMTVVVVAVLLSAPWAAAVPDSVCIQGVLTDASGVPLTGTRVYEVQYYDAEEDGNPLGAAITGSVTVGASGPWSIVLTPPAAVVNAAGEVWYSLAIDSASSPDGSIDPADVFSGRILVGSVYFAQRAGDADSLAGASAASYATDTELSNGLAAKANASHNHNASEINAGALSTNRFSAYDDLGAEAKIGSGAAQVAAGNHSHGSAYVAAGQSNSITSAMITDGQVNAADLQDGAALAEILDDDGPASGLDADLLDGMQGSDYRNASEINAGTLSTNRFNAYDDLEADGRIGAGGVGCRCGQPQPRRRLCGAGRSQQHHLRHDCQRGGHADGPGGRGRPI